MITLSPSKNLNESAVHAHKKSEIRFPEETRELVSILKKKSPANLKALMDISDSLAELNADRYTDFSFPLDKKNARPAINYFMGDVYRGLDAETMTGHDLNYAQKNLRILSGLYGLLRPLDLMQAYRLEMGVSLKNPVGNTLYAFWGNKITEMLNQDIAEAKSKFVLNLASQEYWKAVKVKELSVPVIDVQFREWRKNKWTFVSFTAKKMRGIMARYVIENRIKSQRSMKNFEAEGYIFNPELSQKQNWFFTKQ